MMTKNTSGKIELLTFGDAPVIMQAALAGTVKGFPGDSKDQSYHDHYTITVEYREKSVSFDFYASVHDHTTGVLISTKDQLLDALDSYVSDGLYGVMSFEEFCSELGYDEDSRRAEKVWHACQNATAQWSTLGISADELYPISDLIRDARES
jgi:hypothetical protein